MESSFIVNLSKESQKPRSVLIAVWAYFSSLIFTFLLFFRFGSVVEDEFKELVALETKYSRMIEARRRSLILSVTSMVRDYKSLEDFLDDIGNYYIEMKYKHASLKEEKNKIDFGGPYEMFASRAYVDSVKGSRKGK